MEYFYAVLWVLVGIILIFSMGRENKVFYPIGVFFLILGAWWAADSYTSLNLFAGTWGWVLRGLTLVTLVLACIQFVVEIRKTRANAGKK